MKKSRLKQGAICFFFFLVSGVAAVLAGRELYKGQKERLHAESVSGTIVSREFVEVDTGPGADETRPVVTYRYTYEGTTHTNNDLTPSPRRYHSETRVKELLDKYTPEKEVTVYVLPERPGESFLIKKGFSWWLLGYASFFPLIALACLKGLVDAIRGVEPTVGE